MRTGLMLLGLLVGCSNAVTEAPSSYEVIVESAFAISCDGCDLYVTVNVNGEDHGSTEVHRVVDTAMWTSGPRIELIEGDMLELHLYDAANETLILPCLWFADEALLSSRRLDCSDSWNALHGRLEP